MYGLSTHAVTEVSHTNLVKKIADKKDVLHEGKSQQLMKKFFYPKQCLRRFLGKIGENPSVSKSNWLRLVIFRFSFINWRYIPQIPLWRSATFLESWTSISYFSNSVDSSVTSGRFSPFMDPRCLLAVHGPCYLINFTLGHLTSNLSLASLFRDRHLCKGPINFQCFMVGLERAICNS